MGKGKLKAAVNELCPALVGETTEYTLRRTIGELRKEREELLDIIERLKAPVSDAESISDMVNRDIVKMEHEVSELQRIASFLGSGDVIYHLRKHAAAYKAVLTHYARFKVGDRVQLAKTPNISEKNAPGWLGSQHLLVRGAPGTVVSADFSLSGEGALRYGVQFDNESVRAKDGTCYEVDPKKRHEYSFGEEWLEPLGA